jgi:hypothetical protein
MGSPQGLAGVSRGSAIRVIPVRFLSFSAVRLMNGFEIANQIILTTCCAEKVLHFNRTWHGSMKVKLNRICTPFKDPSYFVARI